jgi:putative transposase
MPNWQDCALRIHKAFRYRVYPSAEQEARLLSWEHALRFLWNLAHEQRVLGLHRPRGERRYYTAFDQMKELTDLRAELPWLADVPRNVCAQLLVELDKAWQRCFRRLARTPRWKRKGRDGVGVCEPHPRVWSIRGTDVRFPKIGILDTVMHRPTEGAPKTCAIVRDGDQWFVVIVCEIVMADPAPTSGPPIALDRGVATLVADSDGVRHDNPRHFERAQRSLARAQRIVARKQKGSKNQQKARLRVARLHRKVRRQRDHSLHQLANHYAHNHGRVIVEKLQIQNMTRSARGTADSPGTNVRAKAGLNRSILGAGWGRLAQMLRYKCAWAGGEFVEVPAAYSSQTCARCGHVAAESRRSQSMFRCVACGIEAHADTNAAKVLLSRGIHGGVVCGGSADVGRPVKQKLRVARRGTRRDYAGLSKATAVRAR